MVETNAVNIKRQNISTKLIEISEYVERVTYHIREPDVRWFYKDASDKRWTPFNGYDSLNLEAAFRVQCVNQQYGVVDESALPNTKHYSNQLSDATPTKKARSAVTTASPNVSVIGGLYDVNVTTRICIPVYWANDRPSIRVLRGVWFRDSGAGVFDPLDDEMLVEHLESEYSSCFLKCKSTKNSADPIESMSVQARAEGGVQSNHTSGFVMLHTVASAPTVFSQFAVGTESISIGAESRPSSPTTSPIADLVTPSTSAESKRKLPLHTVRFPDCHVDFHSPDEVYLYQDSTTLYIRQKLGMQKVGTRLYRGYNQVARADDRPPDVTHLCFVIHGIGQKMGANNIHKCCNELRENCARLQSKYFAQPEYTNQRVEFLPIEWRSSLQLDGDTVESITPVHVRGLRTILNSSAMDIMYYTSPLYRAEISSSLLAELNRMYTLFCSRNPEFESRGGMVSVIAHSLGCVLVYDLITGWSQPFYHYPPQTSNTKRMMPNSSGGPVLMKNGGSASDGTTVSQCNSHTTACDGNHHVSHVPETLPFAQSGMNPEDISLSSQNLQQVARVSLQLEAARTVVSRLEQELSSLLRPNVACTDFDSDLGDKGNGSDLSSVSFHLPEAIASSDLNCSYFTGNSLRFKSNLQNFFCLGSPLPVYLTLRGIRPGAYTTQDSILPRHLCRRILNVYHPSDPVAYRLEPLVLKHYTSIQPALIHRADAPDQPDYDELPLITSTGEELRRNRLSDTPRLSAEESCPTELQDQQRDSSLSPNRQRLSSPDSRRISFASRVLGFFTRSAADVEQSADGEQPLQGSPDTVENSSATPGRPQTVVSRASILQAGELTQDFEDPNAETAKLFCDQHNVFKSTLEERFQHLRLEHRLDYQLRASRYESFYISILTAHTSYWTNADVGMLILSQLFRSS
ncbi:hypothetical protein CRM22_008909 [Opisthorchis felineus]|uniref:DDHD domain-containing protein n=1 Tax=Opisthorchis felineus TaxID=147828 RepID=A0A4S2LH59_OPIFE|nr:hypothetical protein CRM22_008909 [Opisthorchis felineus]TGZ59717.1 hypothetical protein CRM22_008909 [Opisthorchis felineus]